MYGSYTGFAQAAPDTSLNRVFPDSTRLLQNNQTVIREGAASDTIHQETAETAPDRINLNTEKTKRRQLTPKKTGLYSALLPGLGQLYNKEYWKIPVIYAGIAVSAYYFNDNLTNYQAYRKAYIGRFNNPYPTDKYVNLYTQEQLKQLKDDSERYLDLTVLFAGIGYVIQVLDAITFAHLKNFDISKDLTMNVQPVAFPHGAGMGLVINWKH